MSARGRLHVRDEPLTRAEQAERDRIRRRAYEGEFPDVQFGWRIEQRVHSAKERRQRGDS